MFIYKTSAAQSSILNDFTALVYDFIYYYLTLIPFAL